ncbi:MAG: D-glycerate dehydrogenase [Anaerolineae bacterium]|nr:D-glycerate dehydrogenase [Anaerolineae bacterium]
MADRPRVLVTRMIPDAGLDRIRAHCDADIWLNARPIPYDTLLRRVEGVGGMVCMLADRIDAAVMDAAGPGLKVISQYAVGFDNIDVAEAARRGIPVGHTPGVLTESTADMTFAMMMAIARRVPEGIEYVRAGKWRTWGPTLFMGRDIHGATLGIVGLGRVGKAVAERAAGFKMRVLAYDPTCTEEEAAGVGAALVSLEELLRAADFVSLHAPLTSETRGMIDAEALAAMKPGAYLINTARGQLIDQAALTQALQNKQIAGAALDVTDPEPVSARDPLLAMNNVIVLPHIASASVATRDRMAVMAAENLLAGLKGKALPNPVRDD